MQFGGSSTDPFLFETGGTISGDYEFSGTAGIKLQQTTGKISDASDADNHLSFKTNVVEVNKGLTVVGALIAPNLANQAVYPTAIVCNTITNAGAIQTHGLTSTFEIDAPNLIATNQVTAGKVLANEVEVNGPVSVTATIAGLKVKTVDVVSNDVDEKSMLKYDKDANLDPQITIGDENDAMASVRVHKHYVRAAKDRAKWFVHDDRLEHSVADPAHPNDDKYNHTKVNTYDGQVTTFDNYGHGYKLEPAPDANWDNPYLMTFIEGAIDAIGTGPAHHRRLATDYHFQKTDGTMASFKCVGDGSEQLHLPAS